MPINAPSAPPKIPMPKKNAPNKTENDTNVKERREEGLNGFFQMGEFALIMGKLYADAGAIDVHAPKLSHEAAELAERYESLGRGMDYLAEVGPFTALIGAAIPLVLQIMTNHGRLKPEQVSGMGVVPPEVMVSHTQVKLDRLKMEALKQQRESMLEAKRAQEEHDAFMAQMQEEPVNA